MSIYVLKINCINSFKNYSADSIFDIELGNCTLPSVFLNDEKLSSIFSSHIVLTNKSNCKNATFKNSDMNLNITKTESVIELVNSLNS